MNHGHPEAGFYDNIPLNLTDLAVSP